MRVALIPLALGTLTTWLLAGPFSIPAGNGIHDRRPSGCHLEDTGEQVFNTPRLPW